MYKSVLNFNNINLYKIKILMGYFHSTAGVTTQYVLYSPSKSGCVVRVSTREISSLFRIISAQACVINIPLGFLISSSFNAMSATSLTTRYLAVLPMSLIIPAIPRSLCTATLNRSFILALYSISMALVHCCMVMQNRRSASALVAFELPSETVRITQS